MKRHGFRLMISLVTLLTLFLTLSAGAVRAEGEDGLLVPVEISDISEQLSDDTTFRVTIAPEDASCPLPAQTQLVLNAKDTGAFTFRRGDFHEPDDYLYTVTQQKETGDDNVITDETQYKVTVRVVNADSGLAATVEIRENGSNDKLAAAAFRNDDKVAREIREKAAQGGEQNGNNGNAQNGEEAGRNGHGTDDDEVSGFVIRILSPGTGEPLPLVPLGLLLSAAVLGAWGLRRRLTAASGRKDGKGQ